MLGYDPPAERMDRADIRRVKTQKLSEQKSIGAFGELASQLLRYPGAHLLGGSVSKRKNKYLRCVRHPASVCKKVHAPARKDRRLTRTGRSRYQDIPAPLVDSQFLLPGPSCLFIRHRHPPSFRGPVPYSSAIKDYIGLSASQTDRLRRMDSKRRAIFYLSGRA